MEDRSDEEMTCQDCLRPFSEVIDFLVADAIWNFVMAGQAVTTITIRPGLFDKRLQPRSEGVGGVVCLHCFDIRAKAKNVDYSAHLVVTGIGSWMREPQNGMPL